MTSFSFPIQDKFQAKRVVELEFDITPHPELYVDFNQVRGHQMFDELNFHLNLAQDRLFNQTEGFVKILFSGHRGCGKTTELKRFQGYTNDPQRYASILIEIEKECEVGKFEKEDFFVLLIAKLLERLHTTLPETQFDAPGLQAILCEWLSESEVKRELKDHYQIEINTEAGMGWDFFGFLKLGTKFKTLFDHDSTTARTIREKVKRNPALLLERLNEFLAEVRQVLAENNKGQDLLFIVDGSEKMPYEIYKQLFIQEAHLLRSLNANMILSIPINAYFDIQNHAQSEFFIHYLLPMLQVTPQSTPFLAEMITRRLDASRFFEPAVLPYCVSQSGGCPRQLLRIVHRSIIIALGKTITPEIAHKASQELGQQMSDTLDTEHWEVLETQTFDTASLKVRDLLFALVVLKYNGTRSVNPLIQPFLDQRRQRKALTQ